MASFNFIVGTFNTHALYTLSFTPSTTTSTKGDFKILKKHDAVGSHSWISLSHNKKNLYATAWLEPPAIVAYAINSPTDIRLLNSAPTSARSGYVCASRNHVFSAGGAKGDVFSIDPSTGALINPPVGAGANGITLKANGGKSSSIEPVQILNFVSDKAQRDNGSTMDFGGIRHGAHSADLSPDGKYLYIADIGRNCIFTYSISDENTKPLKLIEKHVSPRSNDGPRHAWPHPNGKVLYCVQEHTSVVDVFNIDPASGHLAHVQGVRIIPRDLPASDFWADEVRTSLSNGGTPRYLYASTRGLQEGRKGYVAVYELSDDGLIKGAKHISPAAANSEKEASDHDQGGLLCMYETATSGGWANAVEPGPTVNEVEYLAMTDSEVGYVFVLGWNGQQISEVGRLNLNDDKGSVSSGDEKKIEGAATAVWL